MPPPLRRLGHRISGHKDSLEKPAHSRPSTPPDSVVLPKRPRLGAEPHIKVDYPPEKINGSATSKRDDAAIVVYKALDQKVNDLFGRHTLKIHAIDIQNPDLLAALEPILKRQNVFLNIHETATLTAPFGPLWFAQQEIRELHENNVDSLKLCLGELVKILSELFDSTRARLAGQIRAGLIDFKSAWALFQRNSIIYSYGRHVESIGIAESVEYQGHGEGEKLVIKVQYPGFDGRNFSWHLRLLYIESFQGNKRLTDLPHYPLDFHPNADDVKGRMAERGKKALEFDELDVCSYNSIAWEDMEDQSPSKAHNVTGRVLIDAFGYYKYHSKFSQRNYEHPEYLKRLHNADSPVQDSDSSNTLSHSDSQLEGQWGRLTKRQQRTKKERLAKDDFLGFLPDTIPGYALDDAKWLHFNVEGLKRMGHQEDAFHHLVHDGVMKERIYDWVSRHNREGETSDPATDLIQGKSQGLVILLSGPAGTGKTLMAEAVADRAGRPLLRLETELGGALRQHSGFELRQIFERVSDWGGIILLENAEVLLQTTVPLPDTQTDFSSVFFHELENFRGIMFLTTSKAAFSNYLERHVNIRADFKVLLSEDREKVWRNFMSWVPGGSDVTDYQYSQLARQPLDGRQIKNTFTLLLDWSVSEDVQVMVDEIIRGKRLPGMPPPLPMDDEIYGAG